MIDTSADELEEGPRPSSLFALQRAQRVLDESLDRMESGDSRNTRQIAREGKPIVRRMKPAIEPFLARPPGYDSSGTGGPEKRMEDIFTELDVLLSELDPDPSQLLDSKLDSVTASERTVRGTAFVLVPIGLGGVAACAWLLGLYRRRSESAMRGALETTAEEARTDSLTGLPNRRALIEELERRSEAGEEFTIAIADLNGFKRYNDTFGHPAGDALLRRLGRRLLAMSEGRGMAGRLGGDEFCVVFFRHTPAGEARRLLTGALTDEGEGFHITAEAGVASVPGEAADVRTALSLADTRMYIRKVGAHPNTQEALSHAMTRVLAEHHPGLGTRAEEVAGLAGACAEEMGLYLEDVRSVQRTAELHDLGKVAIPSGILKKEGRLTEEELDFMRHHSIIGERIVAGVPSLEGVASLIRSSHERWDGHGYPDGLAGEAIPIGARIVFVADAFCAMTGERPYADKRSAESACEELRRCAGTQFDPAVVEAFLVALGRRSGQAETARGVRYAISATPVATSQSDQAM